MKQAFEFTLNGSVVRVEGASTQLSLLNYLRRSGCTGSKEGCAEGDCGACTVALVERDARGATTYRAINSCITLLPMVAGREVVTVEGVASLSEGGAHPVQRALVEHYGSQCGYCTPGFAVSMFEGYYRDDLAAGDTPKIADQLCGNLCRCTGYRPIREAMVDVLAKREAARGPNDLFQLRLKKPCAAPDELAYQDRDGLTFHRPATLEALLALRAAHPDAVLVAGATEVGVELNKKSRVFPALISTEGVPELREVRRSETHWHLGGAASLTAVEEGLAGEIPAVHKMLLVFAARQIRSRATLAGNLVTASPIGDMAPVLLALDATVVLSSVRGEREVPLESFFTAYRKTVLAGDEVLREVRVPHAPEGLTRRSDSYKISKRRELDISIVAAAITVDTDAQGVIRKARLGFGGVAATPVRARKTEAALEGRPFDRATLAAAREVLAGEFTPISDVRSGADFRKALLPSLLDKFFDGENSRSTDLPLDFVIEAPRADGDDASRALRHESALGHATGSALYVHDQATRRSMLDVWPVVSPHAHAKILSLETAKAAAIPGVRCVLTARDVPGTNDIGAVRHDEPLFADGEALYHGHMVAAVVADTLEIARAAAALVEVRYEPLPALLTIEQAIAEKSFHTEPHVIKRGDCDAALAASARRVEGSLHIGGQEHFYLESHAAWAEPGDDGDVFVCSSTQHPSEIQTVVSHVLHLPRHRVTVQSPRMGGGFGGKETQGNGFAAIVALAALKTKRPARIQLDRDLDMEITGKRHPFYAEYEAGFDAEGHVTGLRVRLVSDGGYALDLSESICDRALFHLDNAYYLPAVRFEGRVAKTNVVSHTAFRGFGGPQGMVVIEEVMDRIARELRLAPETVRERNLYRGEGETNTTHYGQHLDDNRIGRIWPALLDRSNFAARRSEIDAFNAKGGRIKRGLAITPVKFGISFTATFLNQAGALVVMYRDGTAQVNHGGTEMGQGLYTKVLGVAMRELGLSADRLRVMKTQTDKVPNTSATAASAGADLNGAAVRNACISLRERLAKVAAVMLREAGVPDEALGENGSALRFENNAVRAPGHEAKVPLERVADRAHIEQVQLSSTGFYRTPGIGYDKKAGRGKPFYYFAYGAAVSEVEVDGYTGMKRVLRVDVLHDVGDSLNPAVDRGQVEGAFVQGMGWLTGEELKWSDKGKLLSHSASTYQIPAISDAPVDFRVHLLPDAAQAGTIHGSKAVGEPPLMLALSVREALRDAVAAYGGAGGAVELPSPATHEAIFHALERRTSPERVPMDRAAE